MERKSKKAAEDRIRQESQRLIRETAVTLPRHIPAKIDLDYFIALTADACSLKPSSIQPPAGPPQIPPEPFAGLFELSTDPVVQPGGIQIVENGLSPVDQESSTEPPKSDVNEYQPSASVSLPVAPSLKKFDGFISFEQSEKSAGKSASGSTAANRLLCNEVKKARQPGAKYMILRERLQEDMLKNKQEFLELQKAQYKAEEKAIEEVLDDEEEEELVEEKYEKKAAESSSDEEDEGQDAEEGYTSFEEKEQHIGPFAPCDSGSEPDEADIVDDDYGKDEPEREENEFVDAEAEESGEEEELDEEESDSLQKRSEIPKEKKRKPVDEDSNDLLKLAAHEDSFDENFLDGIGEGPLIAETSNSTPLLENGPTPELPLTQQEELLELCSFAPDQSSIEYPSLSDSTQLMFSSQEQPDPVATQRENDLLDNMESSQERNELLGLLTCPPADFNIPERQPLQSQISEDFDTDGPILRTKARARNRMILDDDEDTPPFIPETVETTNTKPKKPLTTNIMDSDSDTDVDEEMKENTTEGVTEKKRRYRAQSESEKEDDADDELEEDGEADGEEEENFLARPEEDDEEGLADYYEFMNVRDKKGAAAKYFENEAELSDDDQYRGSGDEDEDALDVALPEDIAFVDLKNDKLSKKELRNLQQFHQQAADDEDEEQLELLRNRYLHEEDPLLANTKDIQRPNYLGIDLNGLIEATSSDPPLDPDDPDAILQNNFYFIAQEIRKNSNVEEESEQALLKENSFVQFYESVECREKMGDESLIVPASSQEENPGVFANGKKSKPLGLFGKRPREMTARFTEIVAVEEKLMAPPPVVSSISLPGKLTLPGVGISRSTILARSISNKESANKRLRLANTAHNNGKSIFSLFG